MIKIEVFQMRYNDINIDRAKTPKIRGYFGRKFEEIDCMHNHGQNDKVMYRYPVVQYKTINNNPMIIGVKHGAVVLKESGIILEDELTIDEEVLVSSQQEIVNYKSDFGVTDKVQKYEFVTPWIALNQSNSSKYNSMDEIDREELLKKILIGNMLSMSKGLGYDVSENIKVKINVKEKPVKLKGCSMTGFTGEFFVNFEIPDYLALGKSISRGFGTLKKIG